MISNMNGKKAEIKIPESVQNAIEWIVCFRYHHAARRNNRRRSAPRTEAVDSVVKLIRGHANTFKGFRQVSNLCLYVLLLDDDLSQLMTDMVCAIGAKRKNFVARQLATLFYEASFDLTELIGKDYRNALSEAQVPDAWIDELNDVSKKLNAFKTNHRQFLGAIRNVVAAHREKDAITQYELMAGISPLDIARLGPKLQEPINQLVALQMKLLEHWQKLEVAVPDYLRSNSQC